MPVRLCVGDPILVYLNKDDKTQGIGLIKYIGFIEGYDMTEYVGIELLEQCENGHDGVINGFQYFTSKKKHGIHVRISNIIRKLNATEITIKMQEVISMFKQKLEQYINAVTQRDDYIESLKQAHRNAKNLVKQAQDKINKLKVENHELRYRKKENKNSKNNTKTSGSIADIANIICMEDGDENMDDIDQLQQSPNDSTPSTTKGRRSRHGRNLSAHLQLDTIDDAYALMTPVADIPLLIDQLVQNMDTRRQSFNTARDASPITPMTPVTPSIDSTNDQDGSLDTPASVVHHHVTPMLDDCERVDETPSTIQTKYKRKAKGKIYDRSFPDTTTPSATYKKQKSHRRVASDTTSDRYPFSPDTDQSPSPGPNQKALKKPNHLYSVSVNFMTPSTQMYDERYDETPATEMDDDGVSDYDEESDESEEEEQLDPGDNTPYWSTSGEDDDESNDTRESYTSDSDRSEDEETVTATPATMTTMLSEPQPKNRRSKKRKHRSTKNRGDPNKPKPRQTRQSSVESPRESKKKRLQQQMYYNSAPNSDPYASRAHGATHHHQGSMPVIHMQTRPQKVPQSMNQPPPQHGNKQHDQQNVAYYAHAAMVPQIQPQLDNWMQIKQQQQQPPQQRRGGRHRKQPHNNNTQQNNPYLDRQYLPQFQNNPYQQQIQQQQQQQQQRPIQIYANQQQQQQQPAAPQVKYGHRTFYSDSLNFAAFQQQQQQQAPNANRKAHTKSHKVYVAPRGGRRSYKGKGDKNIQMFEAPKVNNNNYIYE